MTGGRVLRLKKILKSEPFLLTYGDGVSRINIKTLVQYHLSSKKVITFTAVRPPARFGELKIKKNKVISFKEKPQTNQGWINGGFFIAKKKFFKFIKNDRDILEKKPLERAFKTGQLNAFMHQGLWKCMDTIRDKQVIEEVLKRKKI